VSAGPGVAVVVDDPLAQQQLGEPLPGPHQITTAVLPDPDQVPGSLLLDARHRHRGDLIEPQQLRQMDRVLGVGLDPVTRWTLQLRGRCDLAPDPHAGQRPIQAEPRRARLISHRYRPGQLLDPGPDVVMGWSQLRLEQLTRDAIDRSCRDRSGVHVEPNTRTLGKHRGLPHIVG